MSVVVKVNSTPRVHRMQVGPVEAVRLRFQSGVPGPQGPPGVDGQGFSDGDKGDIIVANTGTTMTIDALAVTTTKIDNLAVTTAKIAGDAVDNTKLANMANATIKGRVTAATGDPEDITGAQLRDTILPAGAVIDRAYAEYTTNASLTTVIPLDDTVPTSSEGTQILTLGITPKAVANRIRLTFTGQVATDAAGRSFAITMFNGSTALRTVYGTGPGADYGLPVSMIYEHSPASVAAQTYTVRAGPAAGAMRFNGTNAARLFGGTCAAVLVIEEIKG